MHTRSHARPIGLLIRRKKELTLTADTVRERFSLPLIEMVAGAEVSSLFTLITGYHQILVNRGDVYKDSIRYTLWSIRLARDTLRFHQRARDIPTFVARHCPFCVKSVCGHLLRRSLVSFRKRLKSIKNIYACQSAIFFFFLLRNFILWDMYSAQLVSAKTPTRSRRLRHGLTLQLRNKRKAFWDLPASTGASSLTTLVSRAVSTTSLPAKNPGPQSMTPLFLR